MKGAKPYGYPAPFKGGEHTQKAHTMKLPTISTYGNYSSDNYGAHALKVTVGELEVWFSYKTPIAFRRGYGEPTVRRNDWGPTTGKHLNAIDGGDKKKRVSGDEFERLFAEQCEPATA